MKKMSCLLLCVAFLAGCVDQKDANRPPEEVSLKVAQAHGQQNDIQGVATATRYKRVNGYPDTQASNLYKVDYGFEMALVQDFPQAVLTLAKGWVNEAGKEEQSLQAAVDAANDSLAVINWVNAQSAYEARREALLARCAECKNWMFQAPSQKTKEARVIAFALAWQKLEQMGFKDQMQKGNSVPWHLTVSMMKTEQGWMEAK